MTSYVENVKKNVAGQGILHEFGVGRTVSQNNMEEDLNDIPPPIPPNHPCEVKLSSPPAPPPPDPLNMNTLSYSLPSTNQPTNSIITKPASTSPRTLSASSSHSSTTPSQGQHLSSAAQHS